VMDSEKQLNGIGGVILIALSVYWFWAVALVSHTASEPPWIFLDYANLIFHEAGHILFLPFGNFLHILGGSLMQLIVPGISLVSFIRQQQGLSAGFALFWLGESMSNLSYYIGDARVQALPLIGDDSEHDWNWLLTQTHMLSADTTIAGVVHGLAIMVMLGGLVWMGWSVYKKLIE